MYYQKNKYPIWKISYPVLKSVWNFPSFLIRYLSKNISIPSYNGIKKIKSSWFPTYIYTKIDEFNFKLGTSALPSNSKIYAWVFIYTYLRQKTLKYRSNINIRYANTNI